MILLLRTDKPEAELYLYDKTECIDSITWQAHRELAETIHSQIRVLLHSHDLDWANITAVGCYKGPGSFTGLRIGLTVANTLADSLHVPLVAATGDDWKTQCVGQLLESKTTIVATPDYGRPAHITTQKK